MRNEYETLVELLLNLEQEELEKYRQLALSDERLSEKAKVIVSIMIDEINRSRY